MSALAGQRILVTRPRAQASGLTDKLAAAGAVPILFPTIEIAPLPDSAALDRALVEVERYDWVIFTSVNGVAAVWQRLAAVRVGRPVLWPRVAAIGPATAQALAQRGVNVHFIPDEYVAEAVTPGLGDVAGKSVLLPRADIAREALTIDLARRGALVHELAAYRTLPAAPDPDGLAELRRGLDAITFTSASTVRNFMALLGEAGDAPWRRAAIACIGPVTAGTARELGLPVDVLAREYTMEGLVAALDEFFARRLAVVGKELR